jgi:hypothetical protein
MRMTIRGLAFLLMLGLAEDAAAQTIANALSNANRMTDWGQAGLTTEIPNRSRICATLRPGATSAAINSALAACRDGVVMLSAGTYTVSAGITFEGADHVTLRGAGPDQTIVKFTGGDRCGGVNANVCVRGESQIWSGGVPASQIRDWTAGHGKHVDEITVSSTAGLSVGLMVILDQRDDASDTRGVFVCATLACSQEGKPAGRPGRAQQQFVQIIGINGNRVRISPGVHMVNWRASQQPQLWWWGDSGVMNGVENMTLDHTASQAKAGIAFQNAHDGWVRNVKSLNANRNHVWINQAARIEVRDNYFYGTKNARSQSYGVELFATSDDLVMNNIFQRVTAPVMTGNSAGVVVAYNYMTDMHYTVANWMMAGLQGSHDAGTGMNLFEGNVGNAFLMDNYHGTGNFATVFRNRLTGAEGSKTANTIPVNLFGYNRYVNLVGNVLGTPGHHEVYETSHASGVRGQANSSIYVLGFSGVLESTTRSIPYDPLVVSTLLRWGNYDYATGQARWVSAEIPRGVTAPPSRALPPSLFLASRPSWWAAAIPWPAIGPDVFGGQDPAGHAHKIPAQACFDGTLKKADGTLSFSAPRCYGAASGGPGNGNGNGSGNGNGNGGGQAPSAPSNLKVH